jgi:light-regulated signal transduction histidine kinase (bacteriophytochrome)
MDFQVDLTNCDREPIHTPGSIQPHGAMLVCDAVSLAVLRASANIAHLIGCAASPGCDLADIVGDETAHTIRNAAAKAGGSEIAGIVLGAWLPHVPNAFDITVHRHKDLVFIEFEPAAEGGATAEGALDLTQGLIRRIALESNVDSIAKAGARLVRAMLGYDRVMVYRLLHNGAGRVIAEARRGDLASFMGQHFPASDIPYQARRLYLLNTIRMIANAAYAPVQLEPPPALGEAAIDMSYAQLRSVSPVHCEYLRNMGVRASLSISIVVDGELWGLISCHHDTPKVVPLALRIGAELFGQYFSLQVSVAERRAEIAASSMARERLDRIVGGLSPDRAVQDSLRDHLADFKSLVACDGAAIWIDERWTAVGATPQPIDVRALMELVASEAKSSVWTTQELAAYLDPEAYGTTVAGMLAIPLSSTPRDYLLLFRSEEAHEIEWAGEPVKSLVHTDAGVRLSPRGSFATWLEDVKGRSKPWTAPELAMAEAIRTYLRDAVLRHNEQTAEERTRAEQRRRILNEELNHRVKNIIALVQSIALQTGAHATSVADYSTSLEGRLRALAFAHDQSLAGGNSGDLGTLIEAEASLHRYGAAPDRVTAAGPRVRLDDRTFGVLALVVHEMMTNAAKYGALSVPDGKLSLQWQFDGQGDCEISWTESGGPTVAPPEREGFGSKLIRSTLAYDLGGSAEVDFRPAGVSATFRIPARRASLEPGQAAPAVATEMAIGSLAGLSVLVVEDQALIAMDTEETLRNLGAGEVRLAPSVQDAMRLLDIALPDVAILDFNLGGETSAEIADRLTAQGVPFLFATGYGDGVVMPERFRHLKLLRKPLNGSHLAARIAAARAALRPEGPVAPDPP